MLVSSNAVSSVTPGPLFLTNLFIMCGWLVIFYEKDKIHSRVILRKYFSNTSIHKDTGEIKEYTTLKIQMKRFQYIANLQMENKFL